MTLFIQTDATGAGAGTVNPNTAALNLMVIVNGDTGLGVDAPIGNRQLVTYAQTLSGPPPDRIDALVNTVFNPDYGSGPQQVDIIIVAVGADFFLNDGSSILSRGGTALPPQNSNLPGSTLNTTNQCLALYDTSQNNGTGYCTARQGTGGTLNLDTPNSVILYHELSHAFRIVNNTLLALSGTCNPSSPEENAAITEENDLRTQTANSNGEPVVLRDPGIHCGNVGCVITDGGCCIIASVASGSPISPVVQELRSLRDGLLRRSEVGYAFFDALHYDYYSFSPQVCTLMAGKPALPEVILAAYVEPLLFMLRAMKAAAHESVDDEELGRRFLDALGGPEAREARLAALDQAGRVWLGGEMEDDETALRLSSLLREHAAPSEHVRWALIEPIWMFRAILAGLSDAPDPANVGRALREGIEDWSAGLPIDPVWASLPMRELIAELDTLDSILLIAPRARLRFRRRLRDHFPAIPVIQRLLADVEPEEVPA